MAKLKDLNREVKAMQKRLEKYGQFEGMFLNENYYSLMSEVEDAKKGEYSPQKLSGLVRRIKNVKRSNLIDMFDIYSENYAKPIKMRKAIKLETKVDFKIEELPRIFKEKALDVINKIKERYKKPKTEEYIPPPEPPETEVTISDAVMSRIIDECLYEARHIWTELAKLIDDCINKFGYDEMAEWFENYASDYGTSGELLYEEAKTVYSLLFTWSLNPDLETNKMFTEMVELGHDFGMV